jgi:hypothetical protein
LRVCPSSSLSPLHQQDALAIWGKEVLSTAVAMAAMVGLGLGLVGLIVSGLPAQDEL